MNNIRSELSIYTATSLTPQAANEVYHRVDNETKIEYIRQALLELQRYLEVEDSEEFNKKTTIKFDEGAIEALIQKLKHTDSRVRSSAAEALGTIGDERAVEPLIPVFEDEDGDVRKNAVKAFGKIVDEKAVEPLIQFLKDEDSWVQEGAVEALGEMGWQPKDDIEKANYFFAKSEWNNLVEMGTPAIEPLIQALKVESGSIRDKSAEALGEIGEPAVEPLIQALKDEESDVRKSAAKALGTIGDERAVELLIHALNDEDDWVRSSAAEALGEIGDARAIEPLSQALKDGNENVRWGAARALGMIGDERAIDPLSQALKDGNENVRWGAARALGMIGDERAVKPLIQALKDEDKYVRRGAAEALGAIGDERAVKPLSQALKEDENEDVRINAAEALGDIGDKRAVKPLIQALKDEYKEVRSTAAEALGEIGDKRAVEPLIQVLKDEIVYVRSSAAKALGTIGDERAIEPLTQSLNDKGYNVREYVEGALKKLEGTAKESELDRSNSQKTRDVENSDLEFDSEIVDLRPSSELSMERQAQSSIDGEDVLKDVEEPLVGIEEPAVDPLIEDLKNQDYMVRSRAAETLGEIGDVRAVDPLIQALKDTHWPVQEGAAEALGEIGDARAVEPLIQALKDESLGVQLYATEALKKMDREPGKEDYKSPKSWVVVLWALNLKEKKDYRALAAMNNNQDYSEEFQIWDKQSIANRILEKAGSEAVDAIIAELATGVVSDSKLAELLVDIGDPKAVPLLKKMLDRGTFSATGGLNDHIQTFIEKHPDLIGKVEMTTCALCGKTRPTSEMEGYQEEEGQEKWFCMDTCWSNRGRVLKSGIGTDCPFYSEGMCKAGEGVSLCSLQAGSYATSCYVYGMYAGI